MREANILVVIVKEKRGNLSIRTTEVEKQRDDKQGGSRIIQEVEKGEHKCS